jgi:hypothetical protein
LFVLPSVGTSMSDALESKPKFTTTPTMFNKQEAATAAAAAAAAAIH